jgi:hypothetical protein
VNALSALAATVAGGWVLTRSGEAERRRRPALRAAAVAIGMNGPGGLAYHGPGGRSGKVLHDVALVATVLAVVGVEAADLVADHRTPDVAGPLLLLATGAVVHARSRTGCRWCRPDSAFQGHALWHLVSAAALGWWGTRAAARIK